MMIRRNCGGGKGRREEGEEQRDETQEGSFFVQSKVMRFFLN